jgi:hypothetical protein
VGRAAGGGVLCREARGDRWWAAAGPRPSSLLLPCSAAAGAPKPPRSATSSELRPGPRAERTREGSPRSAPTGRAIAELCRPPSLLPPADGTRRPPQPPGAAGPPASRLRSARSSSSAGAAWTPCSRCWALPAGVGRAAGEGILPPPLACAGWREGSTLPRWPSCPRCWALPAMMGRAAGEGVLLRLVVHGDRWPPPSPR